MEYLKTVIAFMGTTPSGPVWALLSVIVVQLWTARTKRSELAQGDRKLRQDTENARLAAQHAQTQLLFDNQFRQIKQLTEEVDRNRKSAEFFETKYVESSTMIESLRKEIDALRLEIRKLEARLAS